MSDKRDGRQKQIMWLSNEIAKKVSEKSSIIYMHNYLYSYKSIKNFICYCLGELAIQKTDGEIIDVSNSILKYRFLNTPITEIQYHISQVAKNATEGEKIKFTYTEISDFLRDFVCEMLFV